MIDPSYSTPSDPGELSDFSTFETNPNELLWVAKDAGNYVYQVGSPPTGAHPAYVAKR